VGVDIDNFDEIDKLPYLQACIKEGLRLDSPIPSSEPRVVPKGGCVMEGYAIPAGTTISMQPYSLHHHSVFTNPEQFIPERWLNATPEMERCLTYFGMGQRVCIGQHLAMSEMKALFANLYARYRTSMHKGFTDEMMNKVEMYAISIEADKCLIDFTEWLL